MKITTRKDIDNFERILLTYILISTYIICRHLQNPILSHRGMRVAMHHICPAKLERYKPL